MLCPGENLWYFFITMVGKQGSARESLTAFTDFFFYLVQNKGSSPQHLWLSSKAWSNITGSCHVLVWADLCVALYIGSASHPYSSCIITECSATKQAPIPSSVCFFALWEYLFFFSLSFVAFYPNYYSFLHLVCIFNWLLEITRECVCRAAYKGKGVKSVVRVLFRCMQRILWNVASRTSLCSYTFQINRRDGLTEPPASLFKKKQKNYFFPWSGWYHGANW